MQSGSNRSHPSNSLKTGKILGISYVLTPVVPFKHLIGEQIQRFAAKFPVDETGNFPWRNRERKDGIGKLPEIAELIGGRGWPFPQSITPPAAHIASRSMPIFDISAAQTAPPFRSISPSTTSRIASAASIDGRQVMVRVCVVLHVILARRLYRKEFASGNSRL